MAIFQTSVLKKFLKQQDVAAVTKAYKKFVKYFHNPETQENIRAIKEEGFQQKFLMELCVNVFGYIINPDPKYDLTTEYKNLKGAKKADGAILHNGKAVAVIELKSTKTKDLEKIRQQAFDYKANQPGCIYVVTSNFEKLRFYIKNAVDFEEFDLFNLTEERFELLYLCLHKDNLLQNLPLKIKEASIIEEEAITKKFYGDYSLFKRELFRDIVKKNMGNSELKELADTSIKKALFKKTQKLLDRFLFIFFGEDRGLLPPNSIPKILEQWEKLKEMDAYSPLYIRYQKYFNYLDEGWKGKDYEIFAYNGGLFKPDKVLDSINIDDELLYKHTSILTKYDFESQVDVNILGHIFEHSLNEIESVNAEIDGVEFDKQKTKRKKDGVFYTPKYITKYIVDNTIGRLCEEKKSNLGIIENEYLKGRKNRPKAVITKLDNQLKEYRKWLLEITICDPACGSGAFLNQALDFLINEHHWIDEMHAKLLGGAMVFQDVENSILENNIYGVDLNEESVEIAKLSLWLRTAQKGRKLTSLNNNIKCGNSLIDSKSVAGNRAFNWEKEFPEVFSQGGFDVIIGNPPYVQSHAIDEGTKEYIYSKYSTAEYQINTYAIFIEKIFSISRDGAAISIIIPNYWLSTKFDSELRRMIFLENHCDELVNVFMVFEDATVDTLILTCSRTANYTFPKTTNLFSINPNLSTIEQRLNDLDNENWYTNRRVEFKDENADTMLSFEEKLNLQGNNTLGGYFTFKKGMQPYEKGKGTPSQTREMMNERVYHSDQCLDNSFMPLLKARNVKRFYMNGTSGFIKYGKNLAAPRDPNIFKGPRILINRILSRKSIDGIYLEDEYINNTDIFNLIPKNDKVNVKALAMFVMSPICSTFFRKENINLNRAAFPKINVNTLEKFPIPDLTSHDEKRLESSMDQIMEQNQKFYGSIDRFIMYLKSQFKIEWISKKLQSWHELEFGDFIKELNKAIKKGGGDKLSKSDEMDWMELFESKKSEANKLKSEIEKLNENAEQILYDLYDLSDEQIKIIESK